LGIDELGHVHAHGLATRQADVQEAAAIEEVFGGRGQPVPVTAAKSYFGNLGAGGGLVELICSLMAQHQNRLFPVLNYDLPDPECPVHVVQEKNAAAGSSFLTASVTPQGQASVVLVTRIR
jgi:3-oxoacyl-[acyl-carrier-protein] synthase II